MTMLLTHAVIGAVLAVAIALVSRCATMRSRSIRLCAAAPRRMEHAIGACLSACRAPPDRILDLLR